jgi:hypothetical protein
LELLGSDVCTVCFKEIGNKAWTLPEIFLKDAIRKSGYEFTFKLLSIFSTRCSRASRGEKCFLEKGF